MVLEIFAEFSDVEASKTSATAAQVTSYESFDLGSPVYLILL